MYKKCGNVTLNYILSKDPKLMGSRSIFQKGNLPESLFACTAEAGKSSMVLSPAARSIAEISFHLFFIYFFNFLINFIDRASYVGQSFTLGQC